jgi:hypothetical protein
MSPEELFSTGPLPNELQARLDAIYAPQSPFVGLHDRRLTANDGETFVSLAIKTANDQTLPLITRIAFLRIAEDFRCLPEDEEDEFILSWPPIGPLAYGIGLPPTARQRSPAPEADPVVGQTRDIPDLKLRLKLARKLDWGDTVTLMHPSGDPELHFRCLATAALAIAGDKKLHRIIRDRMLEIVEAVNCLGEYSNDSLNLKLGPLAIV